MARSRRYRLALVALMLGALVVTACTATSSGPPTTPDLKGTKPYGSLTIGWPEWGADQLDPAIAPFVSTFQILDGTMFDALVELGPDAKPRPGIAERWEIAPDGMTQTFDIRQGVNFHNGDDLTGADVKFSIERILAPDTLHNFAPAWRASIARVELKDDYTVVVHLKEPRFELLDGLTSLSGISSVVPKKYIDERGVDYFRKNPVGSGPWKFVRHEAGSRLELEAVDSHWRMVPQFRNLTILQIPNGSTMIAMLKTGELDIGAVQPDAAAGLKAAGLRIVDWDTGSQSIASLWWDLNNPANSAFGDVRVRKALSLAVDRKTVADNILRGYAEPSPTVFAVPKYAYFFDSNVLRVDPYDPEQAKRLIAEAGRPKGFKMRVWDRGKGGTLESALAAAYAGYWTKVGIEVEVVPVDFTAVIVPMFRPVVKPELFDTVLVANSAGSVAFENLAVGYHSVRGSLRNVRNPKLDDLIDRVPLTSDPAEKKRLALEAARLAANEYSSIAFMWIRSLVAVGPKVGTLTPFSSVVGLARSYETATHAK